MNFLCLTATCLSLAVGALSATLVAMALPVPASALEIREAEAVVAVMDVLTEDMGEPMVTDAAGIFYDYDAYSGALIPDAGFDRAGWIAAYDAVAAGYLAMLSQAEFDAIFTGPLARLEASRLPEDQKAEMRSQVDALKAEAASVRAIGAAHAEVVRPLEGRLRVLFGSGDAQ
ncbi:hypothetical protein SAMN06295905_1902 [Devosia lucknowensis]|uniref:DUF2059 domain-containing protein n=1 Tax=Devosia lucknowensis TaxID=1096929 RepID=A0A1Y6F6U0_9HYPH|nr:hypothetical protein [Devosia lucknowensis]SMQ70604.1 hypothetical protein SAMN06295905_1902 [Devosia lucknowensis]